MADVEVPNPDDVEEAKASFFTKLVALTVAVYAVALAVCSLGGSNTGKDIMLNQMKASDTWAFYQAKVQRERLFEIESQKLALQIEIDGPNVSSDLKERMQKLQADYQAKSEKYAGEKKEIETDARALEANRDDGLTRDPYFDYGEILLQIAIVVASVAMLGNSKAAYAFSLVIALAGILFTANGYFLFDNGGILKSKPEKSPTAIIQPRDHVHPHMA